MEDTKYLYGDKIVTYSPKKGLWVHYGFEHLGGPEVVDPYGVILDVLDEKPEIQADPKLDVVPEREEYTKKAPFLPHPGCFNVQEGNVSMMEALIKHWQDKPSAKKVTIQ